MMKFLQSLIPPKIISLPRHRWHSPGDSDRAGIDAGCHHQPGATVRESITMLRLITPALRLLVGALVFETGKALANAIAPELSIKAVTL